MAKLEKIDFWVWQDPATGLWSFKTASVIVTAFAGTGQSIEGSGHQTADAAKNEARYLIRGYGFGSRLVPQPVERGWTDEDLSEFDRLVSMMDSRNQMERINGRIDWPKFEARFTKAQLDDMWQHIKDKV